MQLPPLRQQADATVHLSHALDLMGRVHVLVVIKARFAIGLDGSVTRDAPPKVNEIDKLRDEEKPEASSLEYASDLCLRKPAADIVCVGAAMSEGKRLQESLDVLI